MSKPKVEVEECLRGINTDDIYNGPLFIEVDNNGVISYQPILDIRLAMKEESARKALEEFLNKLSSDQDVIKSEIHRQSKMINTILMMSFISCLFIVIVFFHLILG